MTDPKGFPQNKIVPINKNQNRNLTISFFEKKPLGSPR
jgi:hypothetical protein